MNNEIINALYSNHEYKGQWVKSSEYVFWLETNIGKWEIKRKSQNHPTPFVLASSEYPGLKGQLQHWLISNDNNHIALVVRIKSKNKLFIVSSDGRTFDTNIIVEPITGLAWSDNNIIYGQKIADKYVLSKYFLKNKYSIQISIFDTPIIISTVQNGIIGARKTSGFSQHSQAVIIDESSSFSTYLGSPSRGTTLRLLSDGNPVVSQRINDKFVIKYYNKLGSIKSEISFHKNSVLTFYAFENYFLVVSSDSELGLIVDRIDHNGKSTRIECNLGRIISISPAGDSKNFILKIRNSNVIKTVLAKFNSYSIEILDYLDLVPVKDKYHSTIMEVPTSNGVARLHFQHRLKNLNSTCVWLSIYGVFGAKMKPGGRPDVKTWLELGGVHCIVELPDQFRISNTQSHTYDSIQVLLECSEYLIAEGITTPSKLIISGSSGGGLLAASSAILRPDLFAACVVRHAVIDPTDPPDESRDAWALEFGNPQSELELEIIKSWAPLYNIKESQKYPDFLVMCCGMDSRVPPDHSDKLVKKLTQSALNNDSNIIKFCSIFGGHDGPEYSDTFWWTYERIHFMVKSVGLGL